MSMKGAIQIENALFVLNTRYRLNKITLIHMANKFKKKEEVICGQRRTEYYYC